MSSDARRLLLTTADVQSSFPALRTLAESAMQQPMIPQMPLTFSAPTSGGLLPPIDWSLLSRFQGMQGIEQPAMMFLPQSAPFWMPPPAMPPIIIPPSRSTTANTNTLQVPDRDEGRSRGGRVVRSRQRAGSGSPYRRPRRNSPGAKSVSPRRSFDASGRSGDETDDDDGHSDRPTASNRGRLLCCSHCEDLMAYHNPDMIVPGSKAAPEDGPLPEQCDICGDNLRSPLMPAGEKRKFTCHKCGEVFKRTDRLLAHSAIHTGAPHECSVDSLDVC